MNIQSQYGGLGKDYVCPVCKKTFSVPFQTRGGGKTQWAYARWISGHKAYICSYSCTCKWDKDKKKKKEG